MHSHSAAGDEIDFCPVVVCNKRFTALSGGALDEGRPRLGLLNEEKYKYRCHCKYIYTEQANRNEISVKYAVIFETPLIHL